MTRTRKRKFTLEAEFKRRRRKTTNAIATANNVHSAAATAAMLAMAAHPFAFDSRKQRRRRRRRRQWHWQLHFRPHQYNKQAEQQQQDWRPVSSWRRFHMMALLLLVLVQLSLAQAGPLLPLYSSSSLATTGHEIGAEQSGQRRPPIDHLAAGPIVYNGVALNDSANGQLFHRRQRELRPAKEAAATQRGGANLTREQQLQEQAFQQRLALLKQKYTTNRAIGDRSYYILLLVYSLLITFGTVSNSLICLTVILKPQVLSPRNIFIVNLAYSDLLLCVFTMPFSFIEISMKMWQMGLIPCKLVAGLQATSIFVSTISITAIALDRYKVIVYPTHQETSARTAALILGSVWLGALLLSSPLFCFRTVSHLDLPHKYDNIKAIDFCVEDWPFKHGRGIYSVISMIFQYVLPITIVCLVYLKISRKLKKRLIRRQRLTQLECQQKRQLNLIRRTHTMLVSVALVFILSWLPLNLLNVIGDFSDIFKGDDQQFRLVFAVCHLIGCSSACSNPILYGYLNENFRKELQQVYAYHLRNFANLFRHLFCGRKRNGIYAAHQTPSSTSTSTSTENSSSSSSSSNSGSSSSSSSSSSGSQSSSVENEEEVDRGEGEGGAVNQDNDSEKSGSIVRQQENAAQSPRLLMVAATNLADLNPRQFTFNQANQDTGSNSRGQIIGRTMRFCLCANGATTSSTETLGTQQPTPKCTANSLRARRSPNKLEQLAIDLRPIRTTNRRTLASIDKRERDSGNGKEEKKEKKKKKKQAKRFRCKCQCHSGANSVRLKPESERMKTKQVFQLNRDREDEKGRENDDMERKNSASFGADELRRRGSKMLQTGEHHQRTDSNFASAGRRVWLRFFSNNEPRKRQVKLAKDNNNKNYNYNNKSASPLPASPVGAIQRGERAADYQKENEEEEEGDRQARGRLVEGERADRQLDDKQQERPPLEERREKQTRGKKKKGGKTERKASKGEEKEEKNEKTKREKKKKKKKKEKGRKERKRRESGRTNRRHCDSCRERAAAQKLDSHRSKGGGGGGGSGGCGGNDGGGGGGGGSGARAMGFAGAEGCGDPRSQLELGQLAGGQQQLSAQAKQADQQRKARIQGLEMDCLLAGPGGQQPKPFAGALYLSVDTHFGRKGSDLSRERSTSFIMLESSFCEPQSASLALASGRTGEASGLEGSGRGGGGGGDCANYDNETKLATGTRHPCGRRSEPSVDNKAEPSFDRDTKRKPATSSSESAGLNESSRGREEKRDSHKGSQARVVNLQAMDKSKMVRVVLDDAAAAAAAAKAAEAMKKRQQPQQQQHKRATIDLEANCGLKSAPMASQQASAQPEMPISGCSDAAAAATAAAAAASAAATSKPNTPDSASSSSYVCLNSNSGLSASSSSSSSSSSASSAASCTCSSVSSSASGSCSRDGLAELGQLSSSQTVGSSLAAGLEPTIGQGGPGTATIPSGRILPEGQPSSFSLLAGRQSGNGASASGSSCSSGEVAPANLSEEFSCSGSSSLKSSASLEVAQLMAGRQQQQQQQQQKNQSQHLAELVASKQKQQPAPESHFVSGQSEAKESGAKRKLSFASFGSPARSNNNQPASSSSNQKELQCNGFSNNDLRAAASCREIAAASSTHAHIGAISESNQSNKQQHKRPAQASHHHHDHHDHHQQQLWSSDGPKNGS